MDDICRQILMLLSPKSLRSKLSVNRYWYGLTSEVFWKNKVDQDYYFMGKCLQDKSYKDKYYTFSLIFEDEGHVIFGHHRNANNMLYSSVSIKELLKDNVDALVLASIIGIDQFDLETCGWKFDRTSLILNDHCGDCIKVPCTCFKCYFENSLIIGLRNLNTWRNVYDISIFEVSCIIVSTKPIYKERFILRSKYKERFILRSDGRPDTSYCDYDKYPFIEMNPTEQMQCWLNLTDEQRDKIKNEINEMIKATKF